MSKVLVIEQCPERPTDTCPGNEDCPFCAFDLSIGGLVPGPSCPLSDAPSVSEAELSIIWLAVKQGRLTPQEFFDSLRSHSIAVSEKEK